MSPCRAAPEVTRGVPSPLASGSRKRDCQLHEAGGRALIFCSIWTAFLRLTRHTRIIKKKRKCFSCASPFFSSSDERVRERVPVRATTPDASPASKVRARPPLLIEHARRPPRRVLARARRSSLSVPPPPPARRDAPFARQKQKSRRRIRRSRGSLPARRAPGRGTGPRCARGPDAQVSPSTEPAIPDGPADASPLRLFHAVAPFPSWTFAALGARRRTKNERSGS